MLLSPIAPRRSSVRFLDTSSPEGVGATGGGVFGGFDVSEGVAVEEESRRYETRTRAGKPPIVPVELLSRAAAAERQTSVPSVILAVSAVKRSPDEPTVKVALASQHAAQWQQAMLDEINQLIAFGCFLFEDEGNLPANLPPCNDSPLLSHFVLKLKRRADFSIDKFKARLVVDGNRQTQLNTMKLLLRLVRWR